MKTEKLSQTTLSYALFLIKKHEGFRGKVYKCPGGRLTIGYGRNLQDLGVTPEEAEYLSKGNPQKNKDFKSKVFKSPDGKQIIGYGQNIEDLGVTPEEAEELLKNDINSFFKELKEIFPDLQKISDVRQAVLLDMIFNLGKTSFLRFKKFIKYVKQGKFNLASFEMLDSKWSKDVGIRALELSKIMKDDKF